MTGIPNFVILSAASFSFVGNITRSGFNAIQPSKLNAFALPTLGNALKSEPINYHSFRCAQGTKYGAAALNIP